MSGQRVDECPQGEPELSGLFRRHSACLGDDPILAARNSPVHEFEFAQRTLSSSAAMTSVGTLIAVSVGTESARSAMPRRTGDIGWRHLFRHIAACIDYVRTRSSASTMKRASAAVVDESRAALALHFVGNLQTSGTPRGSRACTRIRHYERADPLAVAPPEFK